MSEFKVGDKVRCKESGDAGTVERVFKDGERFSLGFGGVTIKEVAYIEDYDLVPESKVFIKMMGGIPLSSTIPGETDGDGWGRVIAEKFGEFRSEFFPVNSVMGNPKAFLWWMHTPDYDASKKSASEACDGCEHFTCTSKGSRICWEHKLEDDDCKPFMKEDGKHCNTSD